MNVLILEDDEDRIECFAKAFRPEDTVCTTKDLKKFKHWFANITNPFDFIFLDHDMKDYRQESGVGTGYEAALHIALHPERAPKRVFVHSKNNLGAGKIMLVLASNDIMCSYVPEIWKDLDVTRLAELKRFEFSGSVIRKKQ